MPLCFGYSSSIRLKICPRSTRQSYVNFDLSIACRLVSVLAYLEQRECNVIAVITAQQWTNPRARIVWSAGKNICLIRRRPSLSAARPAGACREHTLAFYCGCPFTTSREARPCPLQRGPMEAAPVRVPKPVASSTARPPGDRQRRDHPPAEVAPRRLAICGIGTLYSSVARGPSSQVADPRVE